jgi:hypothetical protein
MINEALIVDEKGFLLNGMQILEKHVAKTKLTPNCYKFCAVIVWLYSTGFLLVYNMNLYRKLI